MTLYLSTLSLKLTDMQCLPMLSDVELSKQERDGRNKNPQDRSWTWSAIPWLVDVSDSSATSKKITSKPCARCRGPHDLRTCQELLKIPLKESLSFLIKKGAFCLRYLEHGHLAKESKCTVRCEMCIMQTTASHRAAIRRIRRNRTSF